VAITGAFIAAMTLAVLTVSIGSPSPARAADPAGNNGTIKVDDVPLDDQPNNEPHVGCRFEVDFYGFDEGDLDAEVTFAAQAPSGRIELLTDTVFIGEDDNGGGGSEAGLDASAEYTLDLAGVEVHPVQGVHVKLTIHADGAQGADVKHKVFWVAECEPPTTTTTTTSTTTTTTTTTTTPPTTTTTTTVPCTCPTTTTTMPPTTTTTMPATTTTVTCTCPTTTTTTPPTTTTTQPCTCPTTTTTIPPTTTTTVAATTTTTTTPGCTCPTTTTKPTTTTTVAATTTTTTPGCTCPTTTKPTTTTTTTYKR
jgi:hypothetical protein